MMVRAGPRAMRRGAVVLLGAYSDCSQSTTKQRERRQYGSRSGAVAAKSRRVAMSHVSRSEAREHACPACKAAPGTRCVGARGKAREAVHRERMQVATGCEPVAGRVEIDLRVVVR